MAFEAAPAVVGGAYGYVQSGGNIDTALQYAQYGAMAGGIVGAFTVKCFVAGTPVHIPSTNPHAVSQTRPIEAIRLGERVLGENPLIARDDACLLEPDWSQYVAVTAKVHKHDGDVLELTTLKPDIWLKKNNVRVGQRTLMDIPVADAHNEALITAINPCPKIQPGPGRVVMSTFKHTATEILQLTIEGEPNPIQTTPEHPFWDEATSRFTQAKDLGDLARLDTLFGPSRPTAIAPSSDSTAVFNLTIHGEQAYRVGVQGILVHNDNAYENLTDAQKLEVDALVKKGHKL